MIARFFNTSKPIHSVIIAGFLLVVYILTKYTDLTSDFSMLLLIGETSKFLIILGSVFVLDFLVSKNKLTKKNGYEILIYSLLLTVFPTTMIDTDVFMANFFLLLALRRIISLRSNLNVKKKLFDGAFWICIASLFYFWSILFLVLILAAIVFHGISQPKNWMVPLFGVLTVFLIVIGYNSVTQNDFGDISNYVTKFEFGFTRYSQKDMMSVIFIASLAIIALVFYVFRLGSIKKAQRPSFFLILITFSLGFLICAISPQKNVSELLFMFPALTVIMSNYVELIKNRILAEIYLWLLIATPLFGLML